MVYGVPKGDPSTRWVSANGEKYQKTVSLLPIRKNKFFVLGPGMLERSEK